MATKRRKRKYFGKFALNENGGVCSRKTLLPPGVARVGDQALAALRLMPDAMLDACENAQDPAEELRCTLKNPTALARTKDQDKITVAAFDFDGTCISGSSPSRLVNKLFRNRLISFYKLFRLGCWGLGYKFNLPTDEHAVRRRLFSAFDGMPAVEINDYLCRFFHDEVSKLYRPEADAAMVAHLEAGHVVVLVSASFEPIVAAAMVEHPIQFAISSRMKVDADGNYVAEVQGLPSDGDCKIELLKTFLDASFGEGTWNLGWAYGDHYSDVTLLESADHPCAVTPDRKLERMAQKRGWDILDWS